MLAVLWFSLCIIALLWAIFSRLYLHPLSKYPGPVHWRLSRLFYMLSIRQGNLLHDIRDMHRHFQSEIIRVAPNELSFINPDCLRDIYGGRMPGQRTLPKDRLRFAPPRPGDTVTVHSASAGPVHDRLRKALSPSFSEQSLSQQMPFVQSCVDKLISVLRKHAEQGSIIDIHEWFGYCIFDITCHFTFNQDFACLDRDAHRDWAGTLTHWLTERVQHAACQYYPVLYRIFDVASSKAALGAFMKHMKINREKIQQRLEEERNPNRPDFIERLKESKAEGLADLTDLDIQANSALLLVAGTHTVHTALTGTMFHLLKTPRAMRKASNELRTRFSNQKQISYDAVKDLPYLQAVIKEGLRMATPAPLGLTRYVPKGGKIICGQYIPQGTIVSYMSWAATTSPTNFHDSLSFIPERWLNQDTDINVEEFAKDKREANAPFLCGPHDCMGQPLAWIEMKLVFAEMLYEFDFETAAGGTAGLGDWEAQRTFSTWVMDPLPVRVGKRNNG